MPSVISASIGLSAHQGWAAAAAVAVERGRLRVLRTDRIETAPAGDREALEPYHVAGGFHGLARVPQPADPERVVKRGLSVQQRFTARSVARIAAELRREGFALATGAVLTGRGRDAPTFAKAIGSHTQIHVQEGLAVRASLRAGLEALGARIRDVDSKQLLAIARDELGRPESALMETLGSLKPDNGGAWRKEEKLAALAAWVAAKRPVRSPAR